MNVERRNLWTAVIAAGLCVLLLVGIAALTFHTSADILKRRPSTFFTDQTGARAILLVLQRVLPSVDQWRRPLTDLPAKSLSTRATLIVMGPSEPLTESEASILDRWIAGGGQLILASNMEWQIRKPQKSERPEKKEDDFIAQGYLSRHGLQISDVVSGESAIQASVTKREGSGRILFISDSYAFSNQTLRITDDAVWLASRASEWSGPTSPIFIDEYHHGFGEKRELLALIGAFLSTSWGFASMQLALAGAIYILGCKRRFGHPIEELPIERTSPVEAVEALGGLFETARARVLSVRTIHQYLNLHLTEMFGRPIDLSNEAVRKTIAKRSSMSQSELDSHVGAIKRAMESQAATDADVVRIARDATTISRSFSHGTAGKRPAAAG